MYDTKPGVDQQPSEGPFDHLLVKPFIHTPPEFISQLQQTHGDPESLVELIRADPALHYSLLKVINSVPLESADVMTDIGQAVSVLGADVISTISCAVVFKLKVEGAESKLKGCWQRSGDLARVCAKLAVALQITSAIDAFSLGLLHDCGIASMLGKYPNYLELVKMGYRFTDNSITYYEDAVVNTNHCMVGYLLAKRWHLPERIAEIQKYHHDVQYLLAGDGRYIPELYMLKMAEDIAGLHVAIGKQSTNAEWRVLKHHILNYFGINEVDYQQLKKQVLAGAV